MKKRLFWGVMVLSAFVLLSFGLFPHWPSYTLDYFQNEPLFKGKPPTYWSRVISSSEIEFDPNAASELRAGGTEAVPVLMELLQHENASIRAQAARILGSMSESSASAVPALKKAASDHNRQVSQAANEALRRIGVETVDWQELASKEGRFFVLMPGKPSEERFPAHMAENIDVVSFYVWMLLPRLAHFAVAYSDHPDVAIKNLTDKESL